jgi:general secretion pathway protein I
MMKTRNKLAPINARRFISSGFTLVEVLVAVAIVAMAVTGILVAMMRQIDGTSYLRDKMFANYVAQNQMELALLTNTNTNQIPTQELSGVEELAGRKWYWRAQPKNSSQPGITQLSITVSDQEGKDAASLASIDVLLDIYHRSGQ